MKSQTKTQQYIPIVCADWFSRGMSRPREAVQRLVDAAQRSDRLERMWFSGLEGHRLALDVPRQQVDRGRDAAASQLHQLAHGSRSVGLPDMACWRHLLSAWRHAIDLSALFIGDWLRRGPEGHMILVGKDFTRTGRPAIALLLVRIYHKWYMRFNIIDDIWRHSRPTLCIY